MTSFHYRAVSAAGEIVEGDMDASTPDAVVESLRKQGHFPLSVGNGSAAPAARRAAALPALRLSGRRRAPSLGGLATTTRELATLVRAGMPLDRGLRFATDMAGEKALRKALERIYQRVQSGAALSEAVSEYGLFPGYYSGMLRAGEAGGNLHQVMDQLASYLDRVYSLRESLRSALVYPVILLLMTVATIIVMFAFVLPQFRPLFEQLGADLPLLTRGFLAAGDFIEAYWWAGLLAAVLAVAAFRFRLRDPAFRRNWDGTKLRMPLIGNIITRVETARFARTLSMLLTGGLPLTEALRIVPDSLTSTVFRDSTEAVGKGLREGGSLARGVARAGAFPPLAVQLIQVGEEAGRLDGVLAELATALETESQRSIQRLLSLMVPTITIILGAIVALVIISVLGAFLSVNDLAY
ncbi:MAG: type II secretion system F family protein [Rhodospirillales bacterium]|nr:MAG: type II secretion system F family protein [Rhodospirillales bacterium]